MSEKKDKPLPHGISGVADLMSKMPNLAEILANAPVIGELPEPTCLASAGGLVPTIEIRPVKRFGRTRYQLWMTAPDLAECFKCSGYNSGMIEYREKGYSYVKDCRGGWMRKVAERFNRARIPAKYVRADSAPFVRMVWDDVERPDWSPGARGWWLCGDKGAGKSWAVAAALRLALRRGANARWVSMSGLQGDIRAGYDHPQFPGERQILEELCNLDLLVIDEICHTARRDSGDLRSFELRLLEEVIDRRNESRLTTWVTSNYTPEDLAECGGVEVARVISRLLDVDWMNQPAKVEGYDVRRLPFIPGGEQ